MIELKSFYRRLERLSGSGPRRISARTFASRWLPELLEHLGAPLGIRALHLYARRAPGWAHVGSWGAGRPEIARDLGERLESRDGSDFPWFGVTSAGSTALLEIEEPLELVAAAFFGDFAGDPAGDRAGHPAGESGDQLEDAATILASLQHAIRQERRGHELESILEQARAIQTSLLPAPRAEFHGYDIAAVSVPASRVGGDIYDFIALDDETLALAIADASGHGIPAALQARDVVTGLRMGVERDLKITRTIEKLNRVIHRSGLVSRFVSLVFGELESNGNFAYINAGHPAPLLLDERGVHELSVGGMILGPVPTAVYKLGFAHVDRGAALALFTDGVVERRDAGGAEFGAEGVERWLRAWRGGPSDAALGDLVERLHAHGRGRFEDDVTAVLVRRTA